MTASQTLYVFVDESGNSSRGDYYVTAGCWCVSNRCRTTVFDPTAQRLREIAEATFRNDNALSELKGSQLPTDILNVLGESFDVAHDDNTISQARPPWTPNHPFRVTVTESHPAALKAAFRNTFGSGLEAPNSLKTFTLLTILDPMFRDSRLSHDRISDIEVVLDAEVWESPADTVRDALETIGFDSPVSFTTNASESTPGIQLADIMAYSWARHLRRGDCSRIVEAIDTYRFAES